MEKIVTAEFAQPAEQYTTSIPGSLSARSSSPAIDSCCVAAPSSPHTESGLLLPDFLNSENRPLPERVRETWEEARAEVEVIQPLVSIDLTRIGQVHIKYLARMKTDQFEPGPESLEVAWFDYSEIPWDELAFPVTHWSLGLRKQDREDGCQRFHRGTLAWNQQGSPLDFKNFDLSDLQSYRWEDHASEADLP